MTNVPQQFSIMGLIRRYWAALLLASFLLVCFVDPILFRPTRLQNAFIQLWSERLSNTVNPDSVPSKWKSVVCLRRLDSSNWVLAAMHHGSCCSVSAPFNCCVLRSSDGKTLVIRDWAPCSGSIEGMNESWCAAAPANSIDELFSRTMGLSKRTH